MKDQKHLKRLGQIWVSNPCYFITVCTEKRRPVLDSKEAVIILREEWNTARKHHGWAVGSYVIMPDHIHFFCNDTGRGTRLAQFMQKWKEWTSKRLQRETGLSGPVWQKGFFDHLLRSSDSYSQKWDYVRCNPVRAGLVESADDWPYSGHVHYL